MMFQGQRVIVNHYIDDGRREFVVPWRQWLMRLATWNAAACLDPFVAREPQRKHVRYVDVPLFYEMRVPREPSFGRFVMPGFPVEPPPVSEEWVIVTSPRGYEMLKRAAAERDGRES